MEITIHALQCGIVGTDETIPDRSKSKNPYAYTGILRGNKHKVWLPVYAKRCAYIDAQGVEVWKNVNGE